jgi:hypothetical protein
MNSELHTAPSVATKRPHARDGPESASDVGREIHVIGDAAEPRRVLEAIREGADVGRKL